MEPWAELVLRITTVIIAICTAVMVLTLMFGRLGIWDK